MSARSKTAPARTATALRLSVDQLEAINALAQEYGMSRSAYMIAASLNQLPAQLLADEKRQRSVEERLARLEQMAELGSYA